MKMLLVVLLLDAGGKEVTRYETTVPDLPICKLTEQAIVSHLSPLTLAGEFSLKTDCRSISLAQARQIH